MANEKRLIDANALWAEFMEFADTSIEFDGEGVANAIANAPSVDAVEVIRCRECKHYGNKDGYKPICRKDEGLFGYPNADDFCSYGEKMECDGNANL